MTCVVGAGGGYPKGRVIEIYGPESSGKTTLALHAIAEIQKAGGEREGMHFDIMRDNERGNTQRTHTVCLN